MDLFFKYIQDIIATDIIHTHSLGVNCSVILVKNSSPLHPHPAIPVLEL